MTIGAAAGATSIAPPKAAAPMTSAEAAAAHQCPPGPPEGQGELGIGAYFVPEPRYAVMTWPQIQQTITNGDLNMLYRNDECEARYAEWAKPIRKKYGSLETYIRQVRLQWDDAGEGTSTNSARFFDDEAVLAKDPSLVRCIPNDWPYGIPEGCGHYVIWCKRPIIHPGLFETADTPFPPGPERDALYAAILSDGIRGLTGAEGSDPPPPRVLGYKTKEVLQRSMSETEAEEMATSAHAWAGRFLERYVERRWNREMWETAWFCNPPHLRTVPGLSHFHVLVRRKARPA